MEQWWWNIISSSTSIICHLVPKELAALQHGCPHLSGGEEA